MRRAPFRGSPDDITHGRPLSAVAAARAAVIELASGRLIAANHQRFQSFPKAPVMAQPVVRARAQEELSAEPSGERGAARGLASEPRGSAKGGRAAGQQLSQGPPHARRRFRGLRRRRGCVHCSRCGRRREGRRARHGTAPPAAAIRATGVAPPAAAIRAAAAAAVLKSGPAGKRRRLHIKRRHGERRLPCRCMQLC